MRDDDCSLRVPFRAVQPRRAHKRMDSNVRGQAESAFR